MLAQEYEPASTATRAMAHLPLLPAGCSSSNHRTLTAWRGAGCFGLRGTLPLCDRHSAHKTPPLPAHMRAMAVLPRICRGGRTTSTYSPPPHPRQPRPRPCPQPLPHASSRPPATLPRQHGGQQIPGYASLRPYRRQGIGALVHQPWRQLDRPGRVAVGALARPLQPPALPSLHRPPCCRCRCRWCWATGSFRW
jgi:hypothetical protein